MQRAKARLFVEGDLADGATVPLLPPQAHYLAHVLRLAAGDLVVLFNGRDGEWRGYLEGDKRRLAIRVAERLRPQARDTDAWLVVAVLKRDALDRLVRAATELGVARLIIVPTRHATAAQPNVDRLGAIVREAAEQCGRLTVPTVERAGDFGALLAGWPPDRPLLIADETGGMPIAAALSARPSPPAAFGILIGPEGGFAASELDALGELPFVSRVSLGPRILRADTAALAALACCQALWGDRGHPPAARAFR